MKLELSKMVLFAIIIISSTIGIENVYAQIFSAEEVNNRIQEEIQKTITGDPNMARVLIISDTEWSGIITDSSDNEIKKGASGMVSYSFECIRDGSWNITFQKNTELGEIRVLVIQNGFTMRADKTFDAFGKVQLADQCYYAQGYSEGQVNNRIQEETQKTLTGDPNIARVLIISDTEWTGVIEESNDNIVTKEGIGMESFSFQCMTGGTWSINFEKSTELGEIRVLVLQNGFSMYAENTSEPFGIIQLASECYNPPNLVETESVSNEPESIGAQQIQDDNQPEMENGGGCLIATATYGSELAPQVQQLRELRDNSLMKTESGSSFMSGFNQLYYSFSPTIADLERESPIFKEIVKLTITPLVTSLSILNYVDMDSEANVLGYGISLILLNIGMYIVAPVSIGIVIARKF